MKHLKLLLVIIGVMVFANVPAATNEYDLHQAVLDNNVQLVKRLLSKGAAINNIGSRKYGYGSALHLAVREGHVEIAQALVDRGAQVDVLDPDDFTPLHNAAWNGNLEMTELLLDAGADINASTYDGDTPLKLARNNDQAQVAEFIQAKLQPAPTQQQISKDPGVIDVSGTYISEITADPHTQRSAYKKPNPEVRLVQNGNEITGSVGSMGKIWGDIEGDTIKFEFLTRDGSIVRGEWTVKPGSNEMVGNWFESWRGSGKWNLTKIEDEPVQVVDISGTYVAETTGRCSVGSSANPGASAARVKKMNGKLIVLKQTGNAIAGSVSPQSNRIVGTREGSIIKLFIITGGQDINSTLEINADGTEMVGKWDSGGGYACSGKWNLKKVK